MEKQQSLDYRLDECAYGRRRDAGFNFQRSAGSHRLKTRIDGPLWRGNLQVIDFPEMRARRRFQTEVQRGV